MVTCVDGTSPAMFRAAVPKVRSVEHVHRVVSKTSRGQEGTILPFFRHFYCEGQVDAVKGTCGCRRRAIADGRELARRARPPLTGRAWANGRSPPPPR